MSTSPQTGSVFSCQTRFGGSGAFRSGAWIRSDGTWDATTKPRVDGEVAWPSATFTITLDGDTRTVAGNDLPKEHTTGVFPIAASDDAFQFDRNPNSIRAQTYTFDLPANPQPAAQPSCTSLGPIGVLLSGVQLFNALDAGGNDAVAHEIQDHCDGHPQPQGAYHYHSLTTCLADPTAPAEHAPLVGYALDGFGIFGPKGEHGEELSTADLDECHGHTHEVYWWSGRVVGEVTGDGRRENVYHYHATADYPYTVGCYRGTPVRTGAPGGGGPGGGPPHGGPGNGPPPGGGPPP